MTPASSMQPPEPRRQQLDHHPPSHPATSTTSTKPTPPFLASVSATLSPDSLHHQEHQQQHHQHQPIPPPPSLTVAAPLPAVLAGLALFSVIGTLVRVKLIQWTSFDGAPIAAIVYPQILGCLIMGVAVRWKHDFSRRWYAMYIAISTGLCGSITTFSTWSLAIYTEGANTASTARSTAASLFASAFGAALVVVAASVAALLYGESAFRDVGAVISPPRRRQGAPSEEEILGGSGDVAAVAAADKAAAPKPAVAFVLSWSPAAMEPADWGLAACGAAAWAVVLAVSAAVPTERALTAAMAFGPLGTLSRYYLSIRLNVKLPWFPLGTFAANMIGTLLIGVTYVMRIRQSDSELAVDLWTAVADGFCGCLTTVSTFTVELMHPAIVARSDRANDGNPSRFSAALRSARNALGSNASLAAHVYFIASVVVAQRVIQIETASLSFVPAPSFFSPSSSTVGLQNSTAWN
ncbi:CrcB-like protein-domain-containing protein [Zopfochytrium polystomum]|nr:CrcB-like protein-domain-containing protein [Zopfochytrium polystomum]